MMYFLSLKNRPFNNIANKKKDIEGRLYSGIFKHLKKGDLLTFTNVENHTDKRTIAVKVVDIFHYPTFAEGFQNIDHARAIPGYTLKDCLQIYNEYYPKLMQQKFGIVLIKIKLVSIKTAKTIRHHNIENVLKECGAFLSNDHFVLVSGRHSGSYINPDKILPHTKACSELGKMMAKLYKEENIDVVIGPAYGGIIFSQWVAFYLSRLKKKEILSIFTEKTPERNQIFDRGFDKLVKGKNVLIVEDITATGSSVVKVIDAIKAVGGTVTHICVIVNRDPIRVNSETFGAPFQSLTTIQIESYEADMCPLCKEHVPINTHIGHGKAFVERQRKT